MMNKTERGLSFSEDALSNRDLFLSDFNDINIYVEDLGKEYLYQEIFEQLLKPLNPRFIFPLGGKSAVINKHQSSALRDDNGKINVFILDGDFDNIWDEQKIISNNLIYLDRYNIESYFCSKEAVLMFMRRFLKKTREEVESIICYAQWEQFFRYEAGELFVLFALVNHYCPQKPNVRTAFRYMNNDGHICSDRVKEYSQCISNEIGPIETYIEIIKERISSKLTGNEEDKVLSIVCGKYQIESLCRYLSFRSGKGIKAPALLDTLLSFLDLSPLSFLRNKILQLATKGYTQNDSA